MRLRNLAGCFLSISFALGLIAAPVMAQPLADRVPDDALFYIGWTGSESLGPGYEGSHLQAMIKESDFPKLINESLPKLLNRIGAQERDVQEVTGLISAIGGPMWRHPSAIYFGGLLMQQGAPPTPKFAILCNAGNEAAPLADTVKKLLANARPPYQINVEEQGGLVMVSAGNQGWSAGQKPANPLANGARFKSALAQVQSQSVFAFYMDVEGIVTLADQLIGGNPRGAQEWPKIKEALGLSGIRRVIATCGFEGKDWATSAFIDAPAPRAGVIPALFDSKPLSDDILKTIPQSATFASAGKLDLGKLFDNIRAAVAKIEPRAAQQFDAALAEVKQQIGIDVSADLLNPMGDEWASYIDPQSSGTGMLGFVIINRARDAAKLEASLTKLEGMANELLKQNLRGKNDPIIQFKQTTVKGAKLHYLAFPVVTPTWAVQDGNLYIGLYPQVVSAAIEQVSSKGRSILENPDYVALQKRLGVKQPTSVSFANLPQTAPDSYQGLLLITRLVLGFGDLFGADTPPMFLPPLKTVMQHLSPAGGAAWVDDAGWHAKSVEPFPGSMMLSSGAGAQFVVAEGALMTAILMPAVHKARGSAVRVKCMSNLRQIGMGIMMYSNDNKGALPPDLGALVKYDLTPSVFVCPDTRPDPGRPVVAGGGDQAAWVNANSDYVYIGAGKKLQQIQRAADTIIVYEKPGNHGGQGMNLLYADGHVEWMSMPQAMQALDKQGVKVEGQH